MKRGKKDILRRVIKIVLLVVLVIAVGAGGVVGWLTLTEYKPSRTESLDIISSDGYHDAPKTGDGIKILT